MQGEKGLLLSLGVHVHAAFLLDRATCCFFDFLNKPLFYTMSEVLLLFSKWPMLMYFKLKKKKLYTLSTTVHTPPAITFQTFEYILLV